MQVDRVEIAKLGLEPGDLLVVKVHGEPNGEAYHNITRAFEMAMEQAGVKAPILIGPANSVDLCVIRAPKVPA